MHAGVTSGSKRSHSALQQPAAPGSRTAAAIMHMFGCTSPHATCLDGDQLNYHGGAVSAADHGAVHAAWSLTDLAVDGLAYFEVEVLAASSAW